MRQTQSFNLCRFSSFFININHQPVQLDLAVARLELRSQAAQEPLQDDLGLHPDHAVVRADHSQVCYVGRAFGQDLFIGGLHVRVRAGHDRRAAVEVAPHGYLFRGRFGVHVDEDDLDRWLQRGELRVGATERVVALAHEDPALQVDYGDGNAADFAHLPAVAGDAGRVIRRAQQSRLFVDVFEYLLLVEDVVA